MAIFFLGLFLGGISGSITYGLTADTQISGIVAAIATILTWLGLATLIFADD